MLVPRSPEAVFAFFEAQNGLGEYPAHSNINWITRACQFERQPWCDMAKSLAYLAAGFNDSGKILDFGTPDTPPAWAQPGQMPHVDGLGYGQTYTWGDAYTWDEQRQAEAAGRWTTDLAGFVPGCTVLVNHNGRGGARNNNSHTCVGLAREPGQTLAWNGNITDQIKQAYWTDSVVEGFCLPAFVTTPPIPAHPKGLQPVHTYESGGSVFLAYPDRKAIHLDPQSWGSISSSPTKLPHFEAVSVDFARYYEVLVLP